ncbi:MAG: tetratricopeptide repeat protein [Nitrospinota bacterium]|nr:tetratricopeptide repeat protein [Nitrospinota bacterium]
MGAGNEAVDAEDPLSDYLDSKIRLFINDKAILSQTKQFLLALKFTNIEVTNVDPSYTGALNQLLPLMMKDTDLILVNSPTAVRAGRTTIKKNILVFFHDFKRLLEDRSKRDSMTLISKCVPIFSEASLQQIREQLVVNLSKFGVSSAFILKQQESLVGLNPGEQKEKKNQQMVERFNEIKTYLIEYFNKDQDAAIQNIKSKQNEVELSRKKQEADNQMKKGAELKKAGRFEEAIDCYRKAIELYPDDPEAYMESGRAYTRVQKYSSAMTRFKQASEVSEDLPTPNKEIGNLIISQVKEKIRKGADPESPEIKKYLNSAVQNFESAMKKAEGLKKLSPDDSREPSIEAVSKIAGDIFKMNLGTLLGKDHEMVRKIGSLAHKTLNNAAGGNPEKLHPAQQITLGLGALEAGNYQEAEKLLFLSAKDEEHLADAAEEINFLGTRLRREKGAGEAIRLYKKLLELSPPNQAPIYFNLAVALKKMENTLDCAGSIVKSVVLDPDLPNENAFYQSPEIFELLKKIMNLFSQAEKNSAQVEISPENAAFYKFVEKLEALSLKNMDEAIKFLYQIAMKMPAFFKNPKIYLNKRIMELATTAESRFSKAANADAKKFAEYLGSFMAQRDQAKFPQNFVNAMHFLALTREEYFKNSNEANASYFLIQAYMSAEELLGKPDFYASPVIVGIMKTTRTKLVNVKIDQLG